MVSLLKGNKHKLQEPFRWSHFFRRFTPLFIVAAILPAVLNTAFSFTQAERSDEVRVWFEPESVIMQKNVPVQLTVMASFDDDTRYITAFTAHFETDQAVTISPQTLSYPTPFRGTTTLGTITVVGNKSGTYALTIPENEVTTSFGKEIVARTSTAQLLVKD